jgi:uncharacterized repeat protein (TIGR01451 family)
MMNAARRPNGQLWCSGWRTLFAGSVLLWAAVGAMPVLGGEDAQPTVELVAEVRVPVIKQAVDSMAPLTPKYLFVKAGTVHEGQEIFYTLRIRNPGNKTLQHAEVVQRLPTNTRYVAGSASGAGALIQFSVDNGNTFADASDLPAPVRSPAGNLVTSYTHIRWQLKAPLPPKSILLARFRAEFF